MSDCLVVDAGVVEYSAAWSLQQRLHARVAEGELSSVLLLLEHPHVYTLGRRGDASDILISDDQLRRLGVEVHHQPQARADAEQEAAKDPAVAGLTLGHQAQRHVLGLVVLPVILTDRTIRLY